MSWTTVDLHGVNPNLEPIAAGDNYVFQLLGGTLEESGRLAAKAAIVSDGEFTGRKVFFSYPDPDKVEWAPRVLKRLEQAMGVDAIPGEDPAGYLNRAALSGARFGGRIFHETYTPEGATEPKIQARLDIFTVRPAV